MDLGTVVAVHPCICNLSRIHHSHTINRQNNSSFALFPCQQETLRRVALASDVIEEHGMVFRDAILEAFGFERGEKAFHRCVIVAAAFAAHT